MPSSGTVTNASPGVLGFDTNTVLSASLAQNFVSDGYRFCLRYLSRSTQGANDLSEAESDAILSAGLALMAVQHVRPAGWSPTTDLGSQDGIAAGKNAAAVGLPAGMNIWCDLEGVKSGTSADDVIGYSNAWYAAVREAGYVPGVYVGYSTGLSEQQLSNLSFQHYWRSQSNVPNIRRGYQLIQLYPQISIHGIEIDVDVTQADYELQHAIWLTPTAASATAGNP